MKEWMNEQKNRVGLKHFCIFNHNIDYYIAIPNMLIQMLAYLFFSFSG